MKLRLAVLAGDGIGPEVTGEAVKMLGAVAELSGHNFEFVPGLIGGVAIAATGSPLPSATLELALEADAVRLGTIVMEPWLRTSVLKPAFCKFGRHWADLPT